MLIWSSDPRISINVFQEFVPLNWTVNPAVLLSCIKSFEVLYQRSWTNGNLSRYIKWRFDLCWLELQFWKLIGLLWISRVWIGKLISNLNLITLDFYLIFSFSSHFSEGYDGLYRNILPNFFQFKNSVIVFIIQGNMFLSIFVNRKKISPTWS